MSANRKLTDEQLRTLNAAASATDSKIGLRVSYWPSGKSLEARGLLEKHGRSVHRFYFITEAGRAAIAKAEGE